MEVKMSQKDYLRKYLSSGDDGKKKKKKKKKLKVGIKTVKIIDDDVDLKNMRPIEDGEFEIFNATNEEAPQIVGIVDERGPVDFADKRRWKIIADDGEGNVAVSSNERQRRDVDDENSDATRGSQNRVEDEGTKSVKSRKSSIGNNTSPSRDSDGENKDGKLKSRKKKYSKYSDSDVSPPRKSKNHSESDSSDDDSKKKKRNRKDSGSSENGDSSSARKLRKKKEKSRKSRVESDSDSSSSKNSDNSDLSPPRDLKMRKNDSRKGLKNNNVSKNRGDSDLDLSPPRKSKDNETSEQRSKRFSRSPGKKPRRQNDSDSDLSPPRKSKNNHRGENSSRRRKDSDSDLSPPRMSKNNHRGENSSRRRKDSDSDLSPPRKSKKNHGGENSSRRRKDSDSDLSPPRKSRKQRDSDSDLSPPRKTKNNQRSIGGNKNSSRSPGRGSGKRGGGGGSDSDLSPPRRSNKEHGDVRRDFRHGRTDGFRNGSERRREREVSDSVSGPSDKYRKKSRSPRRTSRWNDERNGNSRSPARAERDTDKRMKKTLDGKTAGLQDARALRIETEAHRQREADLFKKMGKEMSGADQAPILRDRKTGKRRDLAAEAAARREKEKRQEEIDEKYARWGKGLKQVEDQADKRESDLHEMSKPLARYADDADLDKQLREVMHDGDPMLQYIMEKQIKEGKRKPEQPSYQGSYLPNRFGIKPGHRWDGVDRSNGYEKKWFDARNARTAVQEEAYKWSTADM